ncbi:lysophospholipid acyltransferase family protein [Moraxella marmotae]|uniref:lysophospholipid acyltransferase family protein n=1 Tax=Moraxella marmotae TaxID=3344520 RepID=UPI0035D4803E
MFLGMLKHLPLPILHGLAAFVAFIVHHFNLSMARSIYANLILVKPKMPDDERKRLAKIILKNQLTSTLDSVKCWAMPPEWSVEQITKVHHFDVLQDALRCPNGMLAIVPHIGTWEMMNAWLNTFGTPTIMYKPMKHADIDAFVLQARTRLNATLVPTDTTGVKAIFKTLKDGGFSIVLPDHVPDPSGGVVVPFFGIETMTSTLTPKLAAKTHCALVGLSCIKREDGKGFEVFCYSLDDPKLYDKNAQIATTALNRAMERMICQHFSHYMWGYRRFKHTPLADNPYLLDLAALKSLADKLHEHTNSREHHD